MSAPVTRARAAPVGADAPDGITELESRIAEIEAIGDETTKDAARAIVRGLLALHHKGLVRVLDVLGRGGEAGATALAELAADPVVSSVLVLHDLHPADFETRARSAAERLREAYPDLELVAVAGGVVRATLGGRGGNATASARVVEESFLEAVPDARAVVIDVRKEPALVQLRRKADAP